MFFKLSTAFLSTENQGLEISLVLTTRTLELLLVVAVAGGVKVVDDHDGWRVRDGRRCSAVVRLHERANVNWFAFVNAEIEIEIEIGIFFSTSKREKDKYFCEWSKAVSHTNKMR